MAVDPPVYLDHAAATPLAAEVADAMAEVQRSAFANPSSQHAPGRLARRVLEDARERIIAAVGGGVAPRRDRLVFTSGASEANFLAIVGMAAACRSPGSVLWSRRDHASSRHATAAVADRGWHRRELCLDAASGTVAAAGEAIAGSRAGLPCIVSLSLACGQTGSIEDVSRLAVGGGELVHVDATQAAGFLPLVFRDLPVATLSFAPHKFGGPRGIGGLLIRGGVAIEPLRPGFQEEALRGGTEAVALAVGFARALEIVSRDRDEASRRVESLRDRFESRIVAVAGEAGIAARVVACGSRRVPHVSTIAFPGIDRQALAMAADLAGVCLSTGTACASGSSEPAPVLVAMGLPAEEIRGAVRFSFGRTTTAEEVDVAVARLSPVLRPRPPA